MNSLGEEMLKMIIFGGLFIIGLAAYFLQGKDLSDLQPSSVGQPKVEKFVEEKKEIEKKPGDPLYGVGDCLTKRKDGWEFTKILGVADRMYKVVNCHKYKGCGRTTEIPTYQIEFEYKKTGRKMPCP